MIGRPIARLCIRRQLADRGAHARGRRPRLVLFWAGSGGPSGR
ncbi:hypothetical protein [Lysobacter gummosus]